MSNLHELKTWPGPFEAVWQGIKQYEVRENDRAFTEGDILHLREYVHTPKHYTGRELKAEVTYITRGGQFGLPGDVCVMAIKETSRRTVGFPEPFSDYAENGQAGCPQPSGKGDSDNA